MFAALASNQTVRHACDWLDGSNLLRIAQVTRPRHPKMQSNESLTIVSIVWLIGRDWGTNINTLFRSTSAAKVRERNKNTVDDISESRQAHICSADRCGPKKHRGFKSTCTLSLLWKPAMEGSHDPRDWWSCQHGHQRHLCFPSALKNRHWQL